MEMPVEGGAGPARPLAEGPRAAVLQCGRARGEGQLRVQPAEGVQRPELLGPNRAVPAPAHVSLHQEPRRLLPTFHR